MKDKVKVLLDEYRYAVYELAIAEEYQYTNWDIIYAKEISLREEIESLLEEL